MSTFREILHQIGGAFRWWVIVAPWEQAVRVRLGKTVKVLGAGVHLRIPLADRYYRQSIRRRFSNVPTQTVTTKDGRTVTISGQIGYSIEDLETLYDTLHHAEDTIQAEAQGAVARYVSSHDFDDCQPSAIEERVPPALDLGRYGLSRVEFYVTDFAAPKTYRLIMGEPRDWGHGDGLTTNDDDKSPS